MKQLFSKFLVAFLLTSAVVLSWSEYFFFSILSLQKAAEWLSLFKSEDYPEGAFKKTFETEKMTSRRATHAGSWYTNHGQELSRELKNWLVRAGPCDNPARAIIAPHAGYRYCGACAGLNESS